MSENEKTYTAGEAAKIIGVGEDTVRDWCESGRLKAAKCDWQIKASDLEDFRVEHALLSHAEACEYVNLSLGEAMDNFGDDSFVKRTIADLRYLLDRLRKPEKQ